MDSRPPPASHPPQPLNFCDHLHYPSARIPYRSSKIQSGPFIYPTTIQTPITTLITTTHLNYQIFQLQFCHNSAINLTSHPSWNIWKMAQTLIYSTNHISPSSLEAIFPQSSTTLTTSVQRLLYLLPATFLTVFPPPPSISEATLLTFPSLLPTSLSVVHSFLLPPKFPHCFYESYPS